MVMMVVALMAIMGDGDFDGNEGCDGGTHHVPGSL